MRKSANLLPGGQIGNKGGPGRPKKEFNEKCKRALDMSKAVEWAQGVAAGQLQKKSVISFGKAKVVEVYPTIDERLECAKWLADRGYGKAAQEVELGGDMVREFMAELRARIA